MHEIVCIPSDIKACVKKEDYLRQKRTGSFYTVLVRLGVRQAVKIMCEWLPTLTVENLNLLLEAYHVLNAILNL